MEKYTIQQLAEILVRKNGLSDNDAQAFVSAIFDVIREGLEADKQVKVKGFGTFKIIDVDPRESVNVNTGERVLINGHHKITFTPDSVMKEMVNRPFSQFETVILNDGVDFSDIETSATQTAEPTTEEEQTATDEVATEPVMESQETTLAEEEKGTGTTLVEEEETETTQVEEEKESESTPVEEEKETLTTPADEEKEDVPEPVAEEKEPKPTEVEDDETENEEQETVFDNEGQESGHHYLSYIIGSVACIVLIAAAAYTGYVFGIEEGRHQERLEQIAQQSAYLDKQREEIVAYKQKAKAKSDTLANKTKTNINTTAAQKPKAQAAAKPKEQPAQKQNTEEETDFSEYAKRDVRVRTGAYVIVGIDKVVTAREGQTVGKIAQTHLGPGMSCYVEVVNQMNENDRLKEGTKVKIPKLRHKKARQ